MTDDLSCDFLQFLSHILWGLIFYAFARYHLNDSPYKSIKLNQWQQLFEQSISHNDDGIPEKEWAIGKIHLVVLIYQIILTQQGIDIICAIVAKRMHIDHTVNKWKRKIVSKIWIMDFCSSIKKEQTMMQLFSFVVRTEKQSFICMRPNMQSHRFKQ